MMSVVDNESIFEEYKKAFSSLSNLEYKDGTLIFPNGREVEVDISTLPIAIFEMDPESLYIYLSNHFYNHDEEVYNKEVETIFNLFTQLIITEDEIVILKKFAYDFWLRLQLYSNEKVLANDESFMKELMARRKVITESYRSASEAATILTETYNQNLIQTENTNNNIQESNQNTQVQSNERGLALTRQKAGVPSVLENDFDTKPSKLGVAGFTSVVIIICATLAAGAYLALALLN